MLMTEVESSSSWRSRSVELSRLESSLMPLPDRTEEQSNVSSQSRKMMVLVVEGVEAHCFNWVPRTSFTVSVGCSQSVSEAIGISKYWYN